ncbi:DUF305 domain-containing protein [Kribbella qitaiheensis]|uniref:DUF305 domain-containing protein n=1 Tax=Kribbella qitaiheensis TaxID=1544730 RepID=A0A7G6WW46_9ACTN|nr:DUF305 domain-containing protein [Kribbella qitaiheensis]QNE18211.1 DUF305 domain-containing protein [Kribbella qitaiheensis]
MTRTTRTTAAAATVIVAGALALTGCSSTTDHGSMPGMSQATSPAASTTSGNTAAPVGEHNDADVKFATDMIPHHQQAVQMAQLAATKATTPAVKELAAGIKAAQDPEIKQMSAWLTGWGAPVPSSMAGHDMQGAMPGMMSMDEMANLDKATGPAFERTWLQMMIKHHQGAVTMAKTEQTTGKATAAIALAKKIETGQTAEIDTMQKLLVHYTGR